MCDAAVHWRERAFGKKFKKVNENGDEKIFQEWAIQNYYEGMI